MSGHTPGPWTMQTVQTSCGVCHKIGPFPGKREGDGPRHACLYADYPSLSNPSDAELEANARLIAAAPELYDAAEHALDVLICCCVAGDGVDDRRAILDAQLMLRAAIRKTYDRALVECYIQEG